MKIISYTNKMFFYLRIARFMIRCLLPLLFVNVYHIRDHIVNLIKMNGDFHSTLIFLTNFWGIPLFPFGIRSINGQLTSNSHTCYCAHLIRIRLFPHGRCTPKCHQLYWSFQMLSLHIHNPDNVLWHKYRLQILFYFSKWKRFWLRIPSPAPTTAIIIFSGFVSGTQMNKC